jgi:hypothetical protein
MINRKAKVKDNKGNIKEVDLSSLCGNKIAHTKLNNETLERIKDIYTKFKPYLSINLEQFELGFMRDEDPEQELDLWENLSITFEMAIELFGDTEENKKFIFECLITNSVGALLPEEEKLECVQQLKTLYSKVCAARKIIFSGAKNKKSPRKNYKN